MQHSFQSRDIRNLLLTICYDGRHFHGWQIQQNAFTVQEAFQNALTKIIGDSFDIKGCSRTDTGVHANMYCISVKTQHPIPCERLAAALNRWLPLSVAVLGCKEVGADFHALQLQKQGVHLQDLEQSGSQSVFGRLRPPLPLSARCGTAAPSGAGVCGTA